MCTNGSPPTTSIPFLLQGQRRSQSPEFSDPGMQLEADRIRTRIKDLPTRPEEVEELQVQE